MSELKFFFRLNFAPIRIHTKPLIMNKIISEKRSEYGTAVFDEIKFGKLATTADKMPLIIPANNIIENS
jgi:hypothetical protein